MELTFATLAIIAAIITVVVCWWKNRNKKNNDHNIIADASYGITFFAGLNLIFYSIYQTDIFGQPINYLSVYVGLGGLAIAFYAIKGLYERLNSNYKT